MRKMSFSVGMVLSVAALVLCLLAAACLFPAKTASAAPAGDASSSQETLDYELVHPSSDDFFPVANASLVAADAGYIAVLEKDDDAARVVVAERAGGDFLSLPVPEAGVSGMWLIGSTLLVAANTDGSPDDFVYDTFYAVDLTAEAPELTTRSFHSGTARYLVSDGTSLYVKSENALWVYNSELTLEKGNITHSTALSSENIFVAENGKVYIFASKYGERQYYIYDIELNEATKIAGGFVPYAAANASGGVFVSTSEYDTLVVVDRESGGLLEAGGNDFVTDIPAGPSTLFAAFGDELFVVADGGIEVYSVDWERGTLSLTSELSMSGSGTDRLDSPSGVIEDDSALIIADSGNSRVVVKNADGVGAAGGARVSKLVPYSGRYIAVGEDGVFFTDSSASALAEFAPAAKLIASGARPVDAFTLDGELYLLTEDSLYRLVGPSFSRVRSGLDGALAADVSVRGGYIFVLTESGIHTLAADGSDLRAFRSCDLSGCSDLAVDYAGNIYVSFPAQNAVKVYINRPSALELEKEFVLADHGYPASPGSLFLSGSELLFTSSSCFVGRAEIGAVTEDSYVPPSPPAVSADSPSHFARTTAATEMFDDTTLLDSSVAVPAGTTVLVFDDVPASGGYVCAYADGKLGYVPGDALAEVDPVRVNGAYDLDSGTPLHSYPHLGAAARTQSVLRLDGFDDAAGLDGGVWARVEIDGKTHFVPRSALHEYIVVVPEPERVFGRAVGERIGGIVQLFAAPSDSAPIVTEIVDGTRLEVLEDAGDWWYVAVDGVHGYALKSEVELEGLTPVQIAAIVIAVLVTAIAAGIAVISYQTRKKQKEDG